MRAAYPAFTLAMLLASALCLHHSLGDREDTALYAAALLYGLVLEKATVLAFDAYSYPASEYLLAPLGIPVAIALGWSAVLYAGVATARSLGVPRQSLPGFVGLYALHVDLSMDAVAVRVPYWTWHDPGAWFGVPLGNFFGWFCVAVLLPAWYLGLEGRVSGPWPRAAVAVVLSVASLVPVLEAWTRLTGDALGLKIGILVGGGVLAAAALARWRPTLERQPGRHALAATLVFHLFFLGLVVGAGYYRSQPALLLVAVGMLGVGLVVHWLPGLSRRLA